MKEAALKTGGKWNLSSESVGLPQVIIGKRYTLSVKKLRRNMIRKPKLWEVSSHPLSAYLSALLCHTLDEIVPSADRP